MQQIRISNYHYYPRVKGIVREVYTYLLTYLKGAFQVGWLDRDLDQLFTHCFCYSGDFFDLPRQRRGVLMNLIALNVLNSYGGKKSGPNV